MQALQYAGTKASGPTAVGGIKHEYMCVIGGASGGLAGASSREILQTSASIDCALWPDQLNHRTASRQARFRLIPELENTAKYIQPRYKHPEVVARVLRRHIYPVLGSVAPTDVQPAQIDHVLTRIVDGGAPTVANDALRYLTRMFKMAVRNHWVERNPAAEFDLLDAGGEEVSRDRWLTLEELQQLAKAMQTTPNFGRENELSVWLLLALCVRKMELLSARWDAFVTSQAHVYAQKFAKSVLVGVWKEPGASVAEHKRHRRVLGLCRGQRGVSAQGFLPRAVDEWLRC